MTAAAQRPLRPWLWAMLGLAALAVAFTPAPLLAGQPVERTIRVEAASFEYAPASLHVNPGDRVTLELVATDYAHGLYLDGYELNLTAHPGHTERLTFVADKPGAFRFRCSLTCGPLHPFMIGKLDVGPNWLMWRAAGLSGLAVAAALLLVRP